MVVFKPEVFDRTDWYSYSYDKFGSTDDESFARRFSPDAIFTALTTPQDYDLSDNEQMFRTGIGAGFIESIEVDSSSRDGIIAELRSMGLEEINGRPIEEVVVLRKASPQEAAPDSTGNLDVLSQSLEESPQEAASDSTSNLDAFNQSPEEYAEKQKLEQVKKQAKMQALISGEEPYTSIDEMFNLASVGDDPSTSFKSMVESVVAHGGKVQLSNDMAEFLKKEMSLDELKAIASGEVSDSYTDNDKELFSYLQSMLGIDYNVIYEEALASKSGSTLTPTPPPESPSKSVDDWM